jgi:predicted MFS family arabinose efflux permease
MQKLIYFSLYFSEGAPIGFIWWAMPSILSGKGFSTTEIATISALAAIPWTLKFIFAPLIDLLSMNFVKLKNQLVVYQVAMGVTLLFLEKAIESQQTTQILMVIMTHGFFAALQDISIDAMAIRTIPKDQVGKINGIMQAGMLVGRSIFGGAGVYLAYLYGLDIMVYFLIGSIWISLIIFKSSNFKEAPIRKISAANYLNDFLSLLKRKSIWLLLGVTFFAGFSYNGISTIAGAVLTKKGVSPEVYAFTYSLILPVFMSAGALIGGYLSDRLHAIRTFKVSVLFSILTSLLVGFNIDLVVTNSVLICTYAIFYFFIGSTTASLYGFLMKNTTKEFAALEFSIFMALVNLCDSTSSYMTGQLLLSFNYLFTSAIIGSICLLSLILISIFERHRLELASTP